MVIEKQKMHLLRRGKYATAKQKYALQKIERGLGDAKSGKKLKIGKFF